ncbi:MAG: tetratricopeptide repeat protein [Methylobacter sp.]|nr:tetratricopeptide repeat protein [Methylobacter sp.]
MKKPLTLILLLFSTHVYAEKAPWVGNDLKGLPCNGEGQGYGPWDYTKLRERPKIPIVEHHHFTPQVENHIKGQESYITGDLDYTLRAVPNHHKALLSMIRYQSKLNKKSLHDPRPLLTSPECYLQRAIHFSPMDSGSISLYAYYLKEIGQLEKAADYYQKALDISPDSAKIQYSYSLLLINLKQYDKALEYAQKVYAHGKPPEGLKNKLIKLGVWKIPVHK